MTLRIVLTVFGLLMIGAGAKATELCNESSYAVDAALAWRTESGLAVEGWTRIMPGDCSQMVVPDSEDVFLYARSTPAYLGGVREWRGGQAACVDEADFSIEGVGDCNALGLETRYFRQLTPAERQRAALTELEDYRERADEAGLQRLLRAAGYDIRVIDGYEGRRTRRQITAFQNDVDQNFGTNRADLMAALHAAAVERNSDAGLKVCNDAEAPIAASIARANGEGYLVSGWWRVEPGGCAKAISAHLTAGEVFYHARLLDGDSMRVTSDGDEAFCIAPSRFSTEQRDACDESGFESALFAAAPQPLEGGVELRLDETDFEDIAP